jgi:dipeptide/tripeptide permease
VIDRLTAFVRSLAGFSRPVWAANISELFERVAYYAMTAALVPYLTQVRQFDESKAILIGGWLSFTVYCLTILSGLVADLLGYRRAMIVAYLFLGGGYLGVRLAPTFGIAVVALAFVAFGASVIKPAITGTVQRTCNDEQRPVGFSIYYTLVNIGGFIGPNLTGLVVTTLGLGLAAVFPAAAISIAVALVLVLILYKDPGGRTEAPKQDLGLLAKNFGRILITPRLMSLFILVAGFWSLFFQFWGAMTTYMLNDLGLSQARVGLIISLDAALIVVCQVGVGYLVRHWPTARAVWIGALLGALGFGVMGIAMSQWLVVAGVVLFAIGEMVYSAHFYKYLGSLAPKGQEGMYLGFAFFPIALGSLLAGWVGGPIAAWARTTLGQPERMFWGFGAIGLAAALGLWAHATFYARRDAATA